MKPLRLLAIIEAYSITGPAKNLLEFARLSAEQRNLGQVHVTIATFLRGGAQSNLFTETVARQGTPLEIIPEQGLYDRAVLDHMRRLVARLQPDIVQTHAVKSHFLARGAGLHRQAPWVAFHHGYTWPTLKARVYNQLDRWSLRAARRVLTVSRPFREEVMRFGVAANRIEIVHNAIRPDWGRGGRDPQHAAGLREQLGIAADRNVILIVGRLSQEKDHLSLLEAVRRLPPEHRAHLLIVGDGPERGALRQWIERHQMQRCVTLAGQQPSAEPFYGVAQVAVLSSRTEGSPNALLEAMAAGVPVIATRVGGIPEIVQHGESALLVEPGQAAPLRDALDTLLRDEALRASLAGRAQQRVEAHHSPQARFDALASIYESIREPVRPNLGSR
jgi:glycosyltransferase involved in cell wall biosynthesis